MDDTLRQRLIGLWDGQSQYVMDGPRHYKVLTPNGPEEPVFVPMQEGYGDISTGFAEAPEPKTAKKKTSAKSAPKTVVTDVPKAGE